MLNAEEAGGGGVLETPGPIENFPKIQSSTLAPSPVVDKTSAEKRLHSCAKPRKRFVCSRIRYVVI